ncbi:unnamed protein product [Zymoseptoria tritici ST99CH_1E4]|uniref:Uncharacterized protein n=1 Tax=Zymoseptoria tritici ST99CH_1E4 TaxID=1276532 RepID=A0A2H1GQ96_ZYMTR|nr:unnamed protein product [Zymoseptoria tritici ST99CH_1E4]
MAIPSLPAGSKSQHPLSRSTFLDAESPPAVPDKDTYRTNALPSPPPPTPSIAYLPVPPRTAEISSNPSPERIQEQARSAQNEPFPAFDYCSDDGAGRENPVERIDEEVRKSSWVLNGDLNRADRNVEPPAKEESQDPETAGNAAGKEKKTRKKWFQIWRPKA